MLQQHLALQATYQESGVKSRIIWPDHHGLRVQVLSRYCSPTASNCQTHQAGANQQFNDVSGHQLLSQLQEPFGIPHVKHVKVQDFSLGRGAARPMLLRNRPATLRASGGI